MKPEWKKEKRNSYLWMFLNGEYVPWLNEGSGSPSVWILNSSPRKSDSVISEFLLLLLSLVFLELVIVLTTVSNFGKTWDSKRVYENELLNLKVHSFSWWKRERFHLYDYRTERLFVPCIESLSFIIRCHNWNLKIQTMNKDNEFQNWNNDEWIELVFRSHQVNQNINDNILQLLPNNMTVEFDSRQYSFSFWWVLNFKEKQLHINIKQKTVFFHSKFNFESLDIQKMNNLYELWEVLFRVGHHNCKRKQQKCEQNLSWWIVFKRERWMLCWENFWLLFILIILLCFEVEDNKILVFKTKKKNVRFDKIPRIAIVFLESNV
jgi:hypothetical protein